MLQNNINNFLQYCKNSNFADRSIESLTLRLAEFYKFLNAIPVFNVNEINYQLLSQVIADFNKPSANYNNWSMTMSPLNSRTPKQKRKYQRF